jgi:hypothetical protein
MMLANAMTVVLGAMLMAFALGLVTSLIVLRHRFRRLREDGEQALGTVIKTERRVVNESSAWFSDIVFHDGAGASHTVEVSGRLLSGVVQLRYDPDRPSRVVIENNNQPRALFNALVYAATLIVLLSMFLGGLLGVLGVYQLDQ